MVNNSKKKKQYMRCIKTMSIPTYSELAKEFNMGIKDIEKAMKELVDAGLIKIEGDVIYIYEPISQKI